MRLSLNLRSCQQQPRFPSPADSEIHQGGADAGKLKQYGVSMSSIASDIAGSDITYPAGDTQVGDQKLSVSTEQPFETMDSLNDIPLTVSGGQTVYLSDVAKVYYGRG